MIYIMIISNIYIEIKRIVFFLFNTFFYYFFYFFKTFDLIFSKIFNDHDETYLYILMNIYKILFIYNLILKFHFSEISVFYQNDFDLFVK